MNDEEQPLALRPKPTDLDAMSINELNEYIKELEVEIERIRMEIVRKENQKLTAEAVFRR